MTHGDIRAPIFCLELSCAALAEGRARFLRTQRFTREWADYEWDEPLPVLPWEEEMAKDGEMAKDEEVGKKRRKASTNMERWVHDQQPPDDLSSGVLLDAAPSSATASGARVPRSRGRPTARKLSFPARRSIDLDVPFSTPELLRAPVTHRNPHAPRRAVVRKSRVYSNAEADGSRGLVDEDALDRRQSTRARAAQPVVQHVDGETECTERALLGAMTPAQRVRLGMEDGLDSAKL